MNDDQKLPRELVWQGAHASELALTAIADGQETVVGHGVLEHLEGCEYCAGKLGRVALLSAAVGQAVARVRPSSSRPPAYAVHKPWRALAAGVTVAMLAGLPLVGQVGTYAALALAFVTHGLPVLARGGMALASSEAVSSALPAVTLAASALLVVMGLAIAKTRSRPVEGSAS
jgi:hypothetical protein